MADISVERIKERARFVRELIRYGASRGYNLMVHDFDGLSDQIIAEEVAWVSQGNPSSLVFQLGEQVAKSRR